MKALVWKLNRLVPMTSPGIRSGVNWMRPNASARLAANALREQGLGRARHAFEQDVAADQQAGQQQVDDLVLADDGLADLAANAVSDRANVLHVHRRSPPAIGECRRASLTSDAVLRRRPSASVSVSPMRAPQSVVMPRAAPTRCSQATSADVESPRGA